MTLKADGTAIASGSLPELDIPPGAERSSHSAAEADRAPESILAEPQLRAEIGYALGEKGHEIGWSSSDFGGRACAGCGFYQVSPADG